MQQFTPTPLLRLAATLVLVFCLGIVCAAQFPPLPEGPVPAGEARFAALGDTGNGNDGQRLVAAQILSVQQRARFGTILFLGDNIYNSGSPGDFGRKFTLPYQSFIENGTSLRGVLGNHDVRGRDQGGVLLQQLMLGMGPRPYYSIKLSDGVVEIFALDSNDFISTPISAGGTAQLKWLADALKVSQAKWKIVILHHAMYSSARKHGWQSGDADEMESVRAALEPVLAENGVRIVIAGHDHVYERTKPQRGILHIVSGTGSEVRKGTLRRDSPWFAAGDDSRLSFLLFSVRDSRAEMWSIDSAGTIIDYASLDR